MTPPKPASRGEMIRLSIGLLEHADDIIDDIDRALDASSGGW
jgi:O-acetylhomoserine/O-acetylserine sulfhydrylase-like pyridoxal-dependent enzyme